MLIDGEKYACEACVRGHRVSNCQHSDRPLQHINKKGRPVSQCQHCRSMRKSRATHVKCDCGEKTSKCSHLQQTVDGHNETCCCNHGGRCTCSQRKESLLDTVPESDSEGEGLATSADSRSKTSSRRRRANTVHSDGILAFDQPGHAHHKSSKHGRVSSKVGPYQLNRVNSANSTSSLGANADRESIGGRSRAGSSREQRLVKSEAASPLLGTTGFAQGLPPLDLSGVEYTPYMANNTFDLFGAGIGDQDAPIYSAGLSAPSVDWNNYDWSKNKDDTFTPSSYSQAGTQSYSGMFDFGSGSEQLPHLANTTSTSGDVSEVEDFMPGAEGDYEGYGTGNGFLRQGVTSDISSIDYSSFYKSSESTMAAVNVSMVEEDPAFWIANYNNEPMAAIDDAQDPLGVSAAGYWEP